MSERPIFAEDIASAKNRTEAERLKRKALVDFANKIATGWYTASKSAKDRARYVLEIARGK